MTAPRLDPKRPRRLGERALGRLSDEVEAACEDGLDRAYSRFTIAWGGSNREELNCRTLPQALAYLNHGGWRPVASYPSGDSTWITIILERDCSPCPS